MQVSFGANLIVDKNFGKNPPKRFSSENFDEVLDEYKTFLEDDRIKALTEGYTIALSTKNTKDGYCIYMDFTEKGKEDEEPLRVPICKSKAVNSPFKAASLKNFTFWFIARKSGEEPDFFETFFRYIKRGVLEYAKNINRNNS